MRNWVPALDHYSQTGVWALSYVDPVKSVTPTRGEPQHSVGYITVCIILLIVISYCIQYLVQDCLVGWLYSKLITCMGRSRGSGLGSAT